MYEIDYPLDIGLLKCYSSLCKDYYDVRHVFNSWEDRATNVNRSLSSNLATTADFAIDDDDQQDEGIHIPIPPIPPIIKPPVSKPVQAELESKLLEKFVHVFEVASVVSILFISLSSLCSFGLLIDVLLRCFDCNQPSADLPLLTRRKDNLILFTGLFLLFLSTVSYIKLTYRDLNGGHYVYGIWMLTYTCMLGLICALVSAIISMDDAVSHRDGGYRYEPVLSNSRSNNNRGPVLSNAVSNGRRREESAFESDDQIEMAAAPSVTTHYQYQASQV